LHIGLLRADKAYLLLVRHVKRKDRVVLVGAGCQTICIWRRSTLTASASGNGNPRGRQFSDCCLTAHS